MTGFLQLSYDAPVAKKCGAQYLSRGKTYVCAREAGHDGRHAAAGRTAGKPTLGAAARRRFVTVKFTDAEYALIAELAEREVLPVADVIRAGALIAVARGSTR